MFVSNQGARISYTVLGAGPDVVLLHAHPSCHEMWLPVAEPLAHKFRITLLDLRGHGQSESDDAIITMAQHASDVDRVCRDIGIERAVFAGSSIGGYILFEMWRSYRQRIRGLVLSDTKASADSDEARANREKTATEVMERGIAQFLEGMVPKLLGASTVRSRPDIVDAAKETMRHARPKAVAAVQRGMAQRPDSLPLLPALNVPTLLLFGEEDAVTTRSDAETLQRGIPGSELVIVPKAGHFAIFEQAAEVHRALRKFLDSHY